MAAFLSSRRLEQAVGSLEPEYAVLSAAAAKNAELLALLRGSQPLHWRNDALVIQRRRDASSRRQPATNKHEKNQRLVPEDADANIRDSDRHHRRRVQWEVAKRIARVERELQRQPPTQRFWNVREKQRRKTEEKEESKRRKEEGEEERRKREEDRTAIKKQEHKQKETRRVSFRPDAKPTAPPPPPPPRPPSVDLDLDWETPPKKKPPTNTTASAPLPPPLVRAEELEDDTPDADHKNAMPSSRPVVSHSPVLPPPLDKEHQQLLSIACESLDEPPLHDAPSPSPPPASPSPPLRNPPASSLGRQVLSEYRTMPSSVTFGAPPVVPSGSSRRLHSDVLRRLFSDLDRDRDGHVNRLEVHVALHRLQLDVPASRIVVFFKRVLLLHREDATDPRRRGGSHAPLHEVINYKQFVAFVAAAFEQQEQKRRRGRPEKLQLQLPTLTVPSAPPASSMTKEVVHVTHGDRRAVVAEEVKPRLVELAEDREEPLAERVLRQIPDILTARALDSSTKLLDERSALHEVRRSLEELADGDVEENQVESIARDLVRVYAERMLRGSAAEKKEEEEEEEDVSGLRRAAPFFEALGAEVDGVAEESRADALQSADWWRVLSEEQVAAVVREIWSQRQRESGPRSPDRNDLEEEEEEEGAEVVNAETEHARSPLKEKRDENEEEPPLQIQRVAEKAIQTGSIEWSTVLVVPPTAPPPPPPPSSPPPAEEVTTTVESTSLPPPFSIVDPSSTRSALARAILRTPPPHGAAALDVVATLRRQRLARQRALEDSIESSSRSSSLAFAASPLPSTAPTPPPPPHEAHKASSVFKDQSVESSELSLLQQRMVVEEEEEEDGVATPHPPLPLKETPLYQPPASTPPRPPRYLPSASMSSSSSSSLSSWSRDSGRFSSTTSSINLFRPLHQSVRRHRQYFMRRSLSQKEEEEEEDLLSEGELHADLSDGELFGSSKRRVARAKGIISAEVEPVDSVRSSAESGELPKSVAAARLAFHQSLIRASGSSLESGEMEDGVVASAERHASSR